MGAQTPPGSHQAVTLQPASLHGPHPSAALQREPPPHTPSTPHILCSDPKSSAPPPASRHYKGTKRYNISYCLNYL